MQTPSLHNSNGKMYADILNFSKENNNITYNQFDSFLLSGVNLFDVPNDSYLSVVEGILDKIIQALPAFKRIFAKPIIRLKDTHEVVPVDAVKMIDNRSLSYAVVRSELLEGMTKNGIKPRKLMTVGYVETYELYENIVFAYTVDTILAFIKRSLMLFKDVLYGYRDLHFNLLDRTHHSSYFLAIGKLHIEYVRAQENHQSACSRCIDKLLFIERNLRSKLHSPVYVKCKGKKSTIRLKKTNIFRSHKDYKQIYDILKLLEDDTPDNDTQIEAGVSSFSEEYKAFCIFLTLFAAGHFNFTFSKRKKFDFSKLNTTCTFLDWKLTIQAKSAPKADVLTLSFKKDVEYSSCIILRAKNELSKSEIEEIKRLIPADEYLFACPEGYGEKDILYLSVFDIDSFRRIQQILLRGMIYSDRERKSCPFCGGELEENKGIHECHVCRAQISEAICPETNEKYYLSSIKKHRTSIETARVESERRRFLHDRFAEAQYHFRNITVITSGGEPICPKCGKIHNY